MANLLQFHRENHSTPWGFRLTGGADYDLPLTVIKVTEGSIAENIGMKVGDLLVRVGDTATAGLAHLQAHDLIKNAGDTFEAAVIRGELPEFYTETEQTFDSETTENGMSQSLQINIKTNVVDKTEIIVETGEIIEQNIKINGSVVTNQHGENVDITLNTEEKVIETEESTKEEKTVETIAEISTKGSEAMSQSNEETVEKDPLAEKLEKLLEPPECIKQSEVLKVLKEETRTETKEELLKKEEKRWTTFLQKPKRPKPKIKQKEIEEPKTETSLSSEGRDEHFLFTRLLCVVQEPPYRVIIQKQKKKRDEEKVKEKERAKEMSSHSQQSTPIPEEMVAATPELTSEQEFELRERQAQEESEGLEAEMKHDESEQQTEEFELTDEPMISEVEMSLEDQLAAIQRQLLALTQLPAAIQQTLDAVTQQLTKIVGPVNDPNTEEKELEEEDQQNTSFEDTDKDLEDKTDALETLEEVSESGLDSQHADQEITSQRSDLQSVEDNKTEAELEMLQATPEPPDELLTPEEREAKRLVDKKHKEQEDLMQDLRSRRVKDRPNYPQTPLPRPICLPGGKKWHAPDDAQPSSLHRHKDMSDDLIAETISSQSEILTGTTLGINFLKFQPPPKTLDHLKNSEVYKMIHEMDEQPLRGVGARQGKALAEEDYYSQMQQEGQMKG